MEGFFFQMDELIDILNEDGSATGTSQMKSIAHAEGLFHATVHIWFFTKRGQILLQKRSITKDTFPGLWDVSVAGHIGFGETALYTAIREVKEEIGLDIQKEQLIKIGIFKSVQNHSNTLLDCEFHHTYISEISVPVTSLIKQQSEVDELKLLSLETFQTEVENINTTQYVPHSLQYYSTIIKAIQHQLLEG
ncbi:NUDIX hydrolase [Maribacter sp. MAR_2009_72]|uniref:NUDIX hydrolase n=1 Tax=Maribacter sp. MAR_2009_72 TaxID=1250050 RepID=UPI001199F4F7|nr:NUDIX domain-containing protein [Maribacter sp. MAR_2009_72]TVZ14497.1 isopentenyldiphosphate isomerase [Maribacter sp. MAR_2009_72]